MTHRIRAIHINLVSLPRARALVSHITSGVETCAIVCRIHTEEGIIGNSYGWSVGIDRATLIASVLQGVAPWFIGDDALHIEAAWDKFWRTSNFVGHSGLAMTAMSILDMALWDIRCKHVGLPLWRLLGGHKERAPMYSSQLMDSDPDGQANISDLARDAEQLVLRGFKILKVRMGVNTPAVDVPRIRALVNAIDGKAQIAVDFAQRWDARQSAAACAALDDLGLFWMEDPAPYDDVESIAHIGKSLRTPVTTGENLYYIYEAKRTLDAGGIRYLMLDLQRCGGITGWIKCGALAEAYNVTLTTHVYPDVGVQLVCGTRNCPQGEYLPWWDELYAEPIDFRDGFAYPRATPGIGVEFSRVAETNTITHTIIEGK